MRTWKHDLLGCAVKSSQTGEMLGRVKSVAFHPKDEHISTLLVAPAHLDLSASVEASSSWRQEEERGECLIGCLLFDLRGGYLGESVNAVLGTQSGRLLKLVVKRPDGRLEALLVDKGLVFEGEHWTLRQEYQPVSEEEGVLAPLGPLDDWMIGLTARGSLLDSKGHPIIEAGERVTLSTIEQASRAGILHQLEVEASRE